MTGRKATVSIGMCSAWIDRLVLSGIAGIVTLGATREAFILAFGEDTLLRDLRQISMNAEQNLASWYTSLLMTAGALIAWVAARGEASTTTRRFWHLVATLLLLCAIDETVSFHEVGTLFLPQAREFSPFLHFAWIVFAAPVVAALGFWCLWLMRELLHETRRRLLVSAFVFVAGAVGLELIAGALIESLGEASLVYRVCYILEDTLEMLGLAIFIKAALRHLAICDAAITLHFLPARTSLPDLRRNTIG